MELQPILDLLLDHKWLAATALAVAIIVRLLKSDGPIPINVPPKWRPWLAVGLGIVGGVLDKVARGTSWKDALVGGLAAALVAMTGHDLLVASARNGREFGESKAAFTKRSTPPPPMPPPAA